MAAAAKCVVDEASSADAASAASASVEAMTRTWRMEGLGPVEREIEVDILRA